MGRHGWDVHLDKALSHDSLLVSTRLISNRNYLAHDDMAKLSLHSHVRSCVRLHQNEPICTVLLPVWRYALHMHQCVSVQ